MPGEKTSGMDEAIELVKNGRVYQFEEEELNGHYIVHGRTKKYLVILPNFCTCAQFTFRNIKTPNSVCYHILAARLSQKAKIANKDEWYETLIS